MSAGRSESLAARDGRGLKEYQESMVEAVA